MGARTPSRNDKTRPGEQPLLVGRLIGAPVFTVGDREIEPLIRKSRALLGYLMLSETGRDSRDRLVGQLWSEVEDARARASLRQSLYELRGALEAGGYSGLQTDKLQVWLRPETFEVDVKLVLDAAARGEAHPLLFDVERPIDRLLEGCDGIDPEFGTWLLAKRAAIGLRLERDLEKALRANAGSHQQAEPLARALLNLDQSNEEAARAVMRAKVAVGDAAGALAIYNRLWALLDRDHEIEPSKETQTLVAEIKIGGGSPVPVVQKPATMLGFVPQPVIAPEQRHERLLITVWPFETAACRKEHLYLAQGFRRELLACLVRFREWVVRDISAAMPATIAAARSNGTEYAIEATALPAGDTVRLALTLKDAASGVVLWSERVDLAGGEWLSSQHAVVRRLASALNVNVSAERMAAVSPWPDGDLRAFDTWLRGQSLILSFDPNDWHRAAELFREAIREAPRFSPAYSSLAQLHNTVHFVHPGIFRSQERSEEALRLARQATLLDPVDSRAHLALGWAYALANQHEQAAVHHALANELNPDDHWTCTSTSLGLAFSGDPARGRELIQAATGQMAFLTPIYWRYRAIIEHINQDYAACLNAADRAASDVPNELGWKISALVHLGKAERARPELERFYEKVRRRWCGQGEPNAETMLRWFLHLFPVRVDEDWERLRQGLAGAGAPVEAIGADVMRTC